MNATKHTTRKERISVLLPEDVPAIHSQKRRILRQRPPAEFRMMLQFRDRYSADLPRPAVVRPCVVNQPVRSIGEVALSDIDHGVKRHRVPFLPEKQQVAGTRRIQLPAYKMGVVPPQSLGIGKLRKCAACDVFWRE